VHRHVDGDHSSDTDRAAGHHGGTDVSPERLSKGCTHAFVLSCDDESARDAYLSHSAHRAFVNMSKPHMADVLLLDYLSWPS